MRFSQLISTPQGVNVKMNVLCANVHPCFFELSCLKLRKRGLCYRTKLGSTYTCTAKPIYCRQVVVKENVAFVEGAKQAVKVADAQKAQTPLLGRVGGHMISTWTFF